MGAKYSSVLITSLVVCLLKISAKHTPYFVQEKQKGRKKRDVWHPLWLFLFNKLISVPLNSIVVAIRYLEWSCSILGACSTLMGGPGVVGLVGRKPWGKWKMILAKTVCNWGLIYTVPVLSVIIRKRKKNLSKKNGDSFTEAMRWVYFEEMGEL